MHLEEIMSDKEQITSTYDGYKPFTGGYVPKHNHEIKNTVGNSNQNTSQGNKIIPPKGGTGEQKK